MGIVKGLKNMGRTLDSSSSIGDGPKVEWFKIGDGEKVKVKFLQELDPDSTNYDIDAGVAFIAIEHSNPANFKRKALCSADDQGQCYGCEQHRKDFKAGWKGKSRLYANVLVDNGKDAPFVAVISQGTGPKSITPSIIEYANETGSITDVVWQVKRTGSGNTDTSYNIIPLPTAKIETPAGTVLFDLETSAVRDIAYAEQESFYLGLEQGASSAPQESKSFTSEEW